MFDSPIGVVIAVLVILALAMLIAYLARRP